MDWGRNSKFQNSAFQNLGLQNSGLKIHINILITVMLKNDKLSNGNDRLHLATAEKYSSIHSRKNKLG